MSKKSYRAPRLVPLGSVADLTRTGVTNDGGDGKGGTAASEGG